MKNSAKYENLYFLVDGTSVTLDEPIESGARIVDLQSGHSLAISTGGDGQVDVLVTRSKGKIGASGKNVPGIGVLVVDVQPNQTISLRRGPFPIDVVVFPAQ
jgi:hypothetical protein